MKYCKNCKSTYPNSKNFCENCGKGLVELIEKSISKVPKVEPKHVSSKPSNKQNTLGNNMLKVGIPVIIIIALIGFWSMSTVTTTRTQTESITGRATQNCYTIQEPYTVQVPYQYSYKYVVENSVCEEKYNLNGVYTQSTLTLSNAEDNGGIFTVEFTFTTLDGKSMSTDSKYIQGHSSQMFLGTFDSKLGQDVRCSYIIKPATETRYRDEIQYKAVQKCE